MIPIFKHCHFLKPADLDICCLQKTVQFYKVMHMVQSFFQQFGEKAPGQNWEKMIDLTSELGEINGIEHNKGSKIHILKIKLF